MIEWRTGVPCEAWLLPQIRSAAMNMVMLDQLQEELTGSPLVIYGQGSMGQQTVTQNPLLTTYKDLQRTLVLQFEALGLNYKATPSKLTENTKKGGAEHDELIELLKN